ncbi:MAG: sporulation protein YabP [Ruminococcaceae bacterium]|nr:sporulation protein YabP [Oscillospiraceae bacterium]
MNAEAAQNHREHFFSLLKRERLEVRGVTDVLSFDEQTVVLNTLCGGMEIAGDSIHIHVLNMEQGVVSMDGRIDYVLYFDVGNGEKSEKSGFFKRLFR